MWSSTRRTTGLGRKVICKPPIEEMCDHLPFIASPHICTSNSTIQWVVRKMVHRENVHRGITYSCNKCSNLWLGVTCSMHWIHVYMHLVSHTKYSRGLKTKWKSWFIRISNTLWPFLLSMLMHKFGIVGKTLIEPIWYAWRCPAILRILRFFHGKNRMVFKKTIPPITACIKKHCSYTAKLYMCFWYKLVEWVRW